MFRPQIQKTRVLIIIAIINLSLVFWATHSSTKIKSLGYDDKIKATEIMQKLINSLKEHPQNNIQNLDIYQTGLIGSKQSEITTKEDVQNNMLNSKIACTHPNFTAGIVDIFYDAGLKEGDNVAIGMTGSFPGANIAVISACQSMGINPYIISSVGSSSWGANNPELSWPEMEMYLYENKLINITSLAYTIGGEYDIGGAQLSDEGIQIIEGIIAGIDADKFISSPTYIDNINERMKKYNLGDIDYSAYINIGGGVASLGLGSERDSLIGYVGPLDVNLKDWENSVSYEFLSMDIPVINIKNINILASRFGLYPPNNNFEINEGQLFFEDPENLEDKYSFRIIIISLILSLVLILGIGIYSHIEIRNRMKTYE